jgi:AraC-like DNA-binding protein
MKLIEPVAIYYEHCETGWHVPKAKTNNRILLLMTNGSITYQVENETYRLSKGDVLYIPEGVVRSAVNEASVSHEMYVAHFRYYGKGEGLTILNEERPCQVKLFQYDYMKQRFSLLTQHWLRKQQYISTFCHSILLEMLAVVNEESSSGSKLDRAYSMIVQLQNYIAANYRRTIPMAELAQVVERTPNYVSRLFKGSTGLTITEYTQQLRISAACDLLSNSQMNVGEISDFLGFCEQSHFNKVFKKVTGFPPSVYMKEKVRRWND